MRKKEFIKELREYLLENMPASEAEEYVRYYEDYISRQVAEGKDEVQVLAELGDPRIIGKSVADARDRRGFDESGFGSSTSNETYTSAQTSEKEGRKRKLKLYGTIAIAILLVLVVLIAITKVIAFFFPLIVVVIVLALLFRRR